MSWRTLHGVGLLLLMTSLVESQRIILRSGRHVCRQEKIVMSPITRTRSVCIPFYQRSYRPCPNPRRGLCPFVRVVYRTEFRRVKEMLPRRHTYFSCCPGWTGYDVTHNTCHTPLCDPRCYHGGNCTLPNRCKCPNGWNGTNCQSDVDECNRSPCDQKCTNTGGSFRCECFEGYRLAMDGHSCTLCLSCTDEFTNILQEQKRLQKTIIKLEEHNHIMMKNLTTLHKDLRTLSSLPSLTTPISTTPISRTIPEESGETIEDIADELDTYMSSISEQIAMLEERLDVCTCTRSSSSHVVMGKKSKDHRLRTSSSERRLKAKLRKMRTSTFPPITELSTPFVTTTEKNYLLYRVPSK